MNILLVEDEPGVALVLEYALNEAGHKIIGPLSTFKSAYAMARCHEADLALIDINLADGQTGPALAQKLFSDMGIMSLYVTGSGEEWRVPHDGAFGYISKPYELKAVVESIEAIKTLMEGQTPAYLPPSLRLFTPAAL